VDRERTPVPGGRCQQLSQLLLLSSLRSVDLLLELLEQLVFQARLSLWESRRQEATSCSISGSLNSPARPRSPTHTS